MSEIMWPDLSNKELKLYDFCICVTFIDLFCQFILDKMHGGNLIGSFFFLFMLRTEASRPRLVGLSVGQSVGLSVCLSVCLSVPPKN